MGFWRTQISVLNWLIPTELGCWHSFYTVGHFCYFMKSHCLYHEGPIGPCVQHELHDFMLFFVDFFLCVQIIAQDQKPISWTSDLETICYAVLHYCRSEPLTSLIWLYRINIFAVVCNGLKVTYNCTIKKSCCSSKTWNHSGCFVLFLWYNNYWYILFSEKMLFEKAVKCFWNFW